MIKKVEGVVVREIDYKETSKIIHVFTKELGIVSMIAKGTKNIKSSLSGVTTKLTYGYFYIIYKENNLSTLTEVDIINNFKHIRRDITMISYASFITELVTQVYKYDNDSTIYDLYISSLIKVDEGYDPLVITNILELKLLHYLGINPIIDKCSGCGSTSNIITISSYKGGYLCKACYNGEALVSSKTLKMLRMLYYVDINGITKTDISESVKKEINTFIDEYYDRYAGLYLKSKEFLKNLDKLDNVIS